MSEGRPKRARKIVNYGDDHLHWVEETQIQKALLRSLHEREPHTKIKQADNEDTSETEENVSEDYGSEAQLRSRKTVHRKTVTKRSSPKSQKKIKVAKKTQSLAEENFELRLTRLQSKLLEEHGMFDPNFGPLEKVKYRKLIKDTDQLCHVNLEDINGVNLKTRKNKSPRKKLFSKANHGGTSAKPKVEQFAETDNSVFRVRAQRKFAANASPPRTRSTSPVKMHRQKLGAATTVMLSDCKLPKATKRHKDGHERPVTAFSNEEDNSGSCSSGIEAGVSKDQSKKNNPVTPSVFNNMPKADKFLSYLCYRNTSASFELTEEKPEKL